MIDLFGRASYRLCEKLHRASSDGEDVEMESLLSQLTLDVIWKVVFNYDFDSLSLDNGNSRGKFIYFLTFVVALCLLHLLSNIINTLGCSHCLERSRVVKHFSNTYLGNSNMERPLS